MTARKIAAVIAAVVVAGAFLASDAGAAQRGKARGKANNGPSFCRSGVGHPVYGRQWCLAKGYGLGEAVWHPTPMGRVVFQRVPPGRVQTVRLGPREIAGILSDVVLDEIFGKSHYELDRGALGGVWRGGADDGLFVLEVLVGDSPVAELTDTDLDGEVDVVLIAGH